MSDVARILGRIFGSVAPHRIVFIHRPLVISRKCISRVDCNVDHAVVFGRDPFPVILPARVYQSL